MPKGCLYKIKKTLIGLTVAALSFTTYANSEYNNSISYELDRMVSRANPSVHIGVFVQSLSTGQIYYSKNANTFFAPASVQKLFTVTAALKNLGPDYHFPTRLYTNGSISQGVLRGDLIFQFSGDPSLTRSNLVDFVKKLKAMGINRISGNVIVDNKAFAHTPYPPGWKWDDLSFDFAAPLNTVIIDRNRFGLGFVPNRVGEKVTLVPHLPMGTATFINQTTTTRYPKRNCPLTIFSNEDNQYLIRGCMPRNARKQGRSLAIRNMEMFTNALIRELLREHDIAFHGTIYDAKAPANSTLITEHLSAPLSQVIVHLLKRSDNLYADALLKKLGEQYRHGSGSWQDGVAAVKSVMSTNVGIDPNHVHLNDGAGLSSYNAITPRSISQLLSYIDREPMLRETLIPALPIAGVDGTLRFRMPDLGRSKLVHAKTGSMKGVSSLAGFVQTRTHGLMSFVIMINNIPANRGPYIWLENRICEYLARS